MGNHHSAHIECWIEKHADLEPGERLRGIVKVTVHNEDMVQQSFDGITIVVAGVEYLVVNNGVEEVVVPTSKVMKLRYDIDIDHIGCDYQQPPRTLTRGEHEFPFEIALPTYEEHREHYDQQLKQVPGSQSSIFSESSMSESELSVSPIPTMTKTFEFHREEGHEEEYVDDECRDSMMVQTTIIYHVKARMKRKKNVPLTVDTDIKCHGRCLTTM